LHYRLKFWGQEGDGHLLKPINSSSYVESEIAFQILSPISGFHLYLKDMEKLKIYLVDPEDSLNKIFGHITLNFERHLNKDLSRNTIFHNISGLYPIFKYFPE